MAHRMHATCLQVDMLSNDGTSRVNVDVPSIKIFTQSVHSLDSLLVL